jgi:VWFA-related protein
MSRCLYGAAFWIACAALPAAQGPTFRSAVETVEVDVRVTDRNGRPIRGLTINDFEIREDGRRQSITSLTLIDNSVVRSPDAAPADSTGTLDAAIYVLVLDDLHVEASNSLRARALARQFVEQAVTDRDRVAVRFSGGGLSAAPFTSDKAEILAAIDRFSGRKLPAAAVEESDRRARISELRTWTDPNDPFARERGNNARASMKTLGEVVASLADVRGRRKALVFLSEGIDYDISDAIGRPDKGTEADSMAAAINAAIDAAGRSNTSIYPIDPRGLIQSQAENIGVTALDRRATTAQGRGLLHAQSGLRDIADLTGGFATINVNDATAAFARIASDNSTYYMLSYSPAPDRRPGFHKLEARVARRGATVRSRRGYTSTAPLPAAVAPAPASPTAPAVVVAEPLRESPADPRALAAMLDRIGRYVLDYQRTLAGIVAEEHYLQEMGNGLAGTQGRPDAANTRQRRLRSDLLLVRPDDRWIQFRDVFEVDGRPIRDRDERLYKLFVTNVSGAQDRANAIQEEGARYNIGPAMRTINVPILALAFLEPDRQSRFSYKRNKVSASDTIEGAPAEGDIWEIEYRETGRPTLVRAAGDRDLPSRGRVWVDGKNGRVLKTELISEDAQIRAEVTVLYRIDAALPAPVPAQMRERYQLRQSNLRIEGTATYSRFRQFTVVTSEKPKR